MDVRIRTITFNVADENPPQDIARALFGMSEKEEPPEIFIMALQEVNLGLQVGALLFWDSWTEEMTEFMVKKGYYRIESIRMQGIVLTVFGKRSLLPQIRDVRCDWIGTGQLGFWGNKGAVAIRLRLFDKTIALINAHLPHGIEESQYQQRLLSIDRIFDHVKFSDVDTSILDHDVVIFQGDLNFRICSLSRDDVLLMLEENSQKNCLSQDELSSLLKSHTIVSRFSENLIEFNPTYKYDKRSSNYDSSKKKRKPAWTDRILYKAKEIRCSSYKTLGEIIVSDHRPVCANFTTKMSAIPVADLATIVGNFNPSSNDDVNVNVDIEKDTFLYNQDWIGVYRPDFKDYRDCVTFQWAVFGKRENLGNRIKLKLSIPDILIAGDFIVGYWSAIHQNLIAISNSFHVTPRQMQHIFWD